MKEKILKLSIVFFCICALLSLKMEMFCAYLEDAAAFGEYQATGFMLYEFSPLGFLPMFMPIILLMMMFTRLDYSLKIKSLFWISVINLVSFNHSLIALHGEMLGPVKWIVHLGKGIPCYLLFVTLEELLCYVLINICKKGDKK